MRLLPSIQSNIPLSYHQIIIYLSKRKYHKPDTTNNSPISIYNQNVNGLLTKLNQFQAEVLAVGNNACRQIKTHEIFCMKNNIPELNLLY